MLRTLFTAIVVFGLAAVAHADPVGFTAITDNNDGDGPAVAGQFNVSVADGLTDLHTFTFSNTGPLSSTITQIYIDTGTGPAATFFGIVNGPGVAFDPPPVSPMNLPSQGDAIPPFTSDLGIGRATGQGHGINDGVDPGESVGWTIRFDTPIDAHGTLHGGGMRFGIHVQRIAPGGGSDSFVTNGTPPQTVPEPGIAALLVVAGLLVVRMRRRRRR
ncbi:MAG: PEP-CTERM sorting domain-containing protein [Planctomycetota bacterium]|jgi:hypothetical protein